MTCRCDRGGGPCEEAVSEAYLRILSEPTKEPSSVRLRLATTQLKKGIGKHTAPASGAQARNDASLGSEARAACSGVENRQAQRSRKGALDGRRGVVEVIAVQAKASFQAQRVARAQTNWHHFGLIKKSGPIQ
eukprot:scaffold11739_cov31-Tisochrysis_lutea.AAC.2